MAEIRHRMNCQETKSQFELVASDNSKVCTLVAIKTMKIQRAGLSLIRKVHVDNIVALLDVYRTGEEEICMVYEQMDVSLSLVNSIARGKWNVYEIAAVCKEVLEFIYSGITLTNCRWSEVFHLYTKSYASTMDMSTVVLFCLTGSAVQN